ncbi:MAG: pyridoxamine 5'-phosphate oxidase family protein [Candidatus Paceibacterota bacterium]
MAISATVKNIIETAVAKAVATCGSDGVNVVPVSMVRVNDNTIWLFDFFMDKTTTNLHKNELVALTAWTGMQGIQIKATATYHTSGDDFVDAVAWVKEQNPERVVKGLIVLTPTKVFDISPGGAFLETNLVV